MLSFAFVYAASTVGLFFVVLTSVIVYRAAKKIEEVDDDRKKKVLIAAMGACLFILIFLKYLSGLSIFTQGNLMIFGNEMTIQGVIKKYLLPIGMSYYTLQVISYLLDVYWGRLEAEQDYWKVLLFTCFFPQLVQGPISKYSELAPELFKEHKLDWKNIKYGVQLMLWGFFKKMLIADRIGVYVNAIFHEGVTPYGLTAWIGLVFYGIQLYCDFSGGIDVIRGVSECFGIGLKENFRQPYFSLSLGEFWRRWHISLGAWFKDYLLYPVSMSALCKKINKFTRKKWGNQVSRSLSVVIPASCVWIVTGVWHGAASCFVLWGIYHGILIVSSGLFEIPIQKLCKFLHMDTECFSFNLFRMARTFMLSTIGRIFFAVSAGFTTFFEFLKRMFNFRQFGLHTLLDESLYSYGLDQHNFTLAMLLVALVWGVSMLQEKFDKDGMTIRDVIAKQNILFRWLLYLALIAGILVFGMYGSGYNAGAFFYGKF